MAAKAKRLLLDMATITNAFLKGAMERSNHIQQNKKVSHLKKDHF
jgi:hypothetical protein